mmetsp:Transcript_29272/g.52346  ORF Transcript_29272/g.52346 Transcript_29272/m.52346 type:complete len:588 (+) Transcript_29272:1227-2990(+)
MKFASKYAYQAAPPRPASHLISSSSIQITAHPGMAPPPKPAPAPQSVIDTNVVKIQLDTLASSSQVATGDPTHCTGCGAILNSRSRITPVEGGYAWVCEFCSHPNRLALESEEIPRDSTITYILEGAAERNDANEDDQISVIFCIDISGSMCKVKKVPENVELPSEAIKKRKSGKFTYVSRLECVQASILAQLSEMKRNFPSRKVGLVTFSRSVTLVGDGRREIKVESATLNSFEACERIVKGRHDELMGCPIYDSEPLLQNKVLALEGSGATALGPALLMSVGLASQGKSGSKVIICTDGIANIGLGSLKGDLEEAQVFYEQIGALAVNSGVTVSVVSLTGEECKLETLSILTDMTGGEIDKVDAEKLSQDFSAILAEKTIATHAEVTVRLEKSIVFRNELPGNLNPNHTVLKKVVGNVTQFSNFTFEYTFNPAANDQPTQVHFQVAIDYRTPSGMHCLRVISEVQKVTTVKQKAEKKVEFDLLVHNAHSQNARLAREGDLEAAKVNAIRWQQQLSAYSGHNPKAHEAAEELEDFARCINEQMVVDAQHDSIRRAMPQKQARMHLNVDATSHAIRKYEKAKRWQQS